MFRRGEKKRNEIGMLMKGERAAICVRALREVTSVVVSLWLIVKRHPCNGKWKISKISSLFWCWRLLLCFGSEKTLYKFVGLLEFLRSLFKTPVSSTIKASSVLGLTEEWWLKNLGLFLALLSLELDFDLTLSFET